jgi:hypothetical protein
MDAVLTTIKPIVQKLVEDELKTVIEQNIDKIDTIEPMVDAKLGEVAGKIKALIIDNINKIPFVPDSIKQGFISQIPVDKLIEIITGFDFKPFKATLLAIPTTEISDPTELNKIKTTLTELPDKIKSLLIKHIESVFNGTAAAPSNLETTLPPSKTEESDAAALPPTPPSNEKELEAAKAGFKELDNDEKNETIDKIMEMLKETGLLEEIKKKICTAVPAPPTAAAAAAGGAKKRRRKTKKNIRRNNNWKTRFGRTF